jgi:hypothetical protein
MNSSRKIPGVKRKGGKRDIRNPHHCANPHPLGIIVEGIVNSFWAVKRKTEVN